MANARNYCVLYGNGRLCERNAKAFIVVLRVLCAKSNRYFKFGSRNTKFTDFFIHFCK